MSRPRSGTAKETFFTHASSQIPGGGVWDVYVYDSTNDGAINYDSALVVNAAPANNPTNRKNGSFGVATLQRVQWADAKVTLRIGRVRQQDRGLPHEAHRLSADAENFASTSRRSSARMRRTTGWEVPARPHSRRR